MKRTLLRTAGVAALALVVAGCATSGPYDRALTLPAGSEVEIHQALRMPVESARVFIQDGRVVSTADINRFALSCSFGLERSGNEAMIGTIEPDRFEVVGRVRSWAQADAGDTGPLRVASAGMPRLAMAPREPGSPGSYRFHVELPLRSERQPQVDDLRCEYDGNNYDWYFSPYPGVEAINEALGDVATVTRAGDA